MENVTSNLQILFYETLQIFQFVGFAETQLCKDLENLHYFYS